MSGYTKGPYSRDGSFIIGFNGKALGSVFYGGAGDNSEADATAQLWVAAPAMYEALDCRAGALHMLKLAIEAGGPRSELLIRVEDMLRETRAVLSAASPKENGNG